MGDQSAIEWTEATWNPVTGCDRVSPGCANCYALELAPRLRRFAEARQRAALAAGKPPISDKWLGVRDGDRRSSGPAFGVTLHPDTLDQPLRWRRPRTVFVNSMSDLFHERVPDEFIASVFAVMAAAAQHTFQVLTKRPERMRALLTSEEFREAATDHLVVAYGRHLRMPSYAAWPLPNVWLGVSIENRRFVGRADVLRETPAAVRFISAEPLLGPLIAPTIDDVEVCEVDGRVYPVSQVRGTVDYTWIEPRRDWSHGDDLDLTGIDWLIVGGESGGPAHRSLVDADGLPREDRIGWVRDLRDACQRERTAFFLKQWGGRTPKSGGRLLDGRTWDEMPVTAWEATHA